MFVGLVGTDFAILLAVIGTRTSRTPADDSMEKVLIKQTTIATPIETQGIGLHTAVPVQLRLVPAPPNTGYVFVRTDLNDFEIPASVEWIAHCTYATTLMRKGIMLSTVEHLLAALRGAALDNVFIEIDNLELP